MRTYTTSTLHRWKLEGTAELIGDPVNGVGQLRWKSGTVETIGVKGLAPGVSYTSVREFKVSVLREVSVENTLMDTPEKVAEFWNAHVPTAPWYQEGKETMVLFTINTRRRVTGFNMISIGTLDTILVHPRDVFRPAIIDNAAAIAIAHNHPSGDPTPSEADIKVTRDLIRAGQLLKIELLDHVVIGSKTVNPKGYMSLRELGYFYS